MVWSNDCFVTILNQVTLTINTRSNMKAKKKETSIASEAIRHNLELRRTYIPELDLSKLGGSLDRVWFIKQVIWHDNGSRAR